MENTFLLIIWIGSLCGVLATVEFIVTKISAFFERRHHDKVMSKVWRY